MNRSSVWQISIRPDCLFHPDFSGYRCRSVHSFANRRQGTCRTMPYPMRPWPDRLNRMTFSSPVSLHLFASRTVAAMAWQDSGAGMIPSACEKAAGFERFELFDVRRFHIAVFQQLRYDDAGTVIAQTAGVDVGGSEIMSQGKHRQ